MQNENEGLRGMPKGKVAQWSWIPFHGDVGGDVSGRNGNMNKEDSIIGHIEYLICALKTRR